LTQRDSDALAGKVLRVDDDSGTACDGDRPMCNGGLPGGCWLPADPLCGRNAAAWERAELSRIAARRIEQREAASGSQQDRELVRAPREREESLG
jgi:hypothetical protein